MTHITQTPEWHALIEHKRLWHDLHLRELFAKNPERFQQFSHKLNNMLFDFSKNYLIEETVTLLMKLAKASNIEDKIKDLFAGKHINRSEDKSALHMALRHPVPKSFFNKTDNIPNILKKIQQFVTQVHNGTWKGYTNETITDVVHIGVGGSLLGPMMVTKALSSYANKLNIHFVSTLDGKQAIELIKKINPARTLFIIVSKTFTTEDTLANAIILKDWFNSHASSYDDYKKHFLGVSANRQAMSDFGIQKENQFEFWDFVGGRYSIWSAVGLIVALAIGVEQFITFLKGAYIVDQHFQKEPLKNNIPIIMALLTIWYRNFIGNTSQVILPYDSQLEHFPSYLQQLEMESCGKSVTHDGKTVDYKTGQVIWGDIGTNGEHAFYQLLHQGTEIIPADFIVPIRSVHNLNDNQDLVLAHALAQSQALMLGKDEQKVFSEFVDRKLSKKNMQALALQRSYPGNKPSTVIMFPSLTPHILGSLIACYEHKVFVQSAIWNINPFDQWGTELGKRISKNLLPLIRGKKKKSVKLDSSTKGLLNCIKINKEHP